MTDPAIVVDVVDARLRAPAGADALEVLVEPAYGCVAVAAALDAGWEAVEIAEPAPDAPPLPLVSFEQGPPPGASRCRLRAGDLARHARPGMLLGAPVLARPLCARLAAASPRRITFVAVPAGAECELAADSWWACGMLVRVLLEELEVPSALTDAAGLAVTLARGAEDARAQLSIGVRWQRHLDAGGHPDDLRVAAGIDAYAVVPEVVGEAGAIVARAWPVPHSGS